MITANTLLNYLPPYSNEEYLITEDQSTNDIVKEVLNSHKYFCSDYDTIFQYFYNQNIKDTCRNLFNFCKENIVYKVEDENEQTTKSPAAILSHVGKNDCKHFANFIGGVLSAIERNTGEKIDFVYRFANYSFFKNDMEHVFIVVKNEGKEIWIDPVLCCFNIKNPVPSNYIDKKIKNTCMLKRISGIEDNASSQSQSLLRGSLTQLLQYGIIDLNGNINKDRLYAVLENLDLSQRQALNVAYKYVMNYQSGTIGSFLSVLGDIGKTVLGVAGGVISDVIPGSSVVIQPLENLLNKPKASTPAPAPVQTIVTTTPPASTSSSFETYLPFIAIGGIIIFAIIEQKKKRRS